MGDIIKDLEEARVVAGLSRKLAKNIYGFNGDERITYLNGGLGNQLCQYFFYRFLECTGKAPVIADDTFFYHKNEHNGLEIEKLFGYRMKKLSDYLPGPVFIDMVNRKVNGESVPEQIYQAGYSISVIGEANAPEFSGPISWMMSYFPAAAKNTGLTYYHVYAILGDYFLDLAKANAINPHPFPPLKGEQNEKYAGEIKSTESVALHIRKGDFIKMGWDAPPEVYKNAVEAVSKSVNNPTFFVFSDDLKYCKEHIEELGLMGRNAIFVEGNERPNNYIDMQLMTMCKHRIMNNSSFCLCAALFREDREGLILNLNPTMWDKF